MGHKTHPVGFRLGVIKDWQSRWFAHRAADYRKLVQEDLSIRSIIFKKLPDAGISRVEIERGSQELVVNIHTARPGIVIGRGGSRVEELRQALEQLTEKKARLNVVEIRNPELDAFLVARNIADQLERRIAYRRAMRQGITRTMQAGAKGVKILASGRLSGAEIARKEKAMDGRVPLHTLRADIDFAIAEARTQMGAVGVKVWIYKGDILPELAVADEDMATIEFQVNDDGDEETGLGEGALAALETSPVAPAPAAEPEQAPTSAPQSSAAVEPAPSEESADGKEV